MRFGIWAMSYDVTKQDLGFHARALAHQPTQKLLSIVPICKETFPISYKRCSIVYKMKHSPHVYSKPNQTKPKNVIFKGGLQQFPLHPPSVIHHNPGNMIDNV